MALTLIERLRVTPRSRCDWYRALADTTRNGLPLFDVLARMEAEFAKHPHPLGPIVRELVFRLKGFGSDQRGGGRRTLGTELRGLVPDTEAMLIQAGVMSGDMTAGLLNAAIVVENQGRLRSAAAALIKPGGYLLALAGLLLYLGLKVFPGFSKGRPRSRWPADAQLLGWISDHIIYVVGSGTLLFVALVLLLAWIAPRWTGARREWADRHVFPFTTIASVNGASFLTSLAAYISSGVPINDAITNIRKSASPYMAWQCDRMAALIKELRPEAALCELSIIQGRYQWIVKVYGLSGDATAAFKSIAEQMTQRTEMFIKTFFDHVLSTALQIFIGVVIAWIFSCLFSIVDSGTRKAALVPTASSAASIR